MQTISKIMPRLLFQACLIVLLCWPVNVFATPGPSELSTNIEKPSATPEGNYASLTSLVNAICNDAILQFNDFFTPSAVTVHPFRTMDNSPRQSSILGVVLADQMLAVINNETSGRFAMEHSPTETQELTGLLQEMDGYLRIHISGRNEAGEQRSHVVAVEMSEPLYRALHTTVSPE